MAYQELFDRLEALTPELYALMEAPPGSTDASIMIAFDAMGVSYSNVLNDGMGGSQSFSRRVPKPTDTSPPAMSAPLEPNTYPPSQYPGQNPQPDAAQEAIYPPAEEIPAEEDHTLKGKLSRALRGKDRR
jgi:hypothetical protein